MTTTLDDALDLQVSECMQAASRALCDLKYRMDMDSRDPVLQAFQDDWMGTANSCAYFGSSFLAVVVPFLDSERDPVYQPFEAMVDCRQVLSSSIKGMPHNIPPERVSQVIEHYSTHHKDYLSKAQYWWYQPLGILVANEGKHRVAFMREHGDLPIAAKVTPKSYPAPERIKLVEVTGRYWRCFALLDGRYLQVVHRPQVTKAYLSAYGVETVLWSSLKDMPNLDLVGVAMLESKNQRLDLQMLLDFESEVGGRQPDEPVNTLGLEGFDFTWWGYLTWSISCFLLALLALAVFNMRGWQALELIGMGLGGIAAGLALSLSVLQWRKLPERNLLAAWFRRGRF